jgi:hypothetical protein
MSDKKKGNEIRVRDYGLGPKKTRFITNNSIKYFSI